MPADQVDKVKKMEAKEKNAFFRKWSVERAKQAGVNGVYILICKDPTWFWEGAAPQARGVFAQENDERLREILVRNFKQKKFDDGLLSMARYVQEVLTGSQEAREGGDSKGGGEGNVPTDVAAFKAAARAGGLSAADINALLADRGPASCKDLTDFLNDQVKDGRRGADLKKDLETFIRVFKEKVRQ